MIGACVRWVKSPPRRDPGERRGVHLHDDSGRTTMYRKRERTQNWSLEEKMYLLQLVKSRLDVLENKRIDSASSAMKGMAWQDIHAAFAARFGNDRDAHRVREQWRRMKGQARTEMMEFAERVRNYGAEVAGQRWPSALSEDVWKTLESARKVDDYQQGHGIGDDVGSPITMDDEEEDADDMLDYTDSRVQHHDRLMEKGDIKTEPDDGERFERLVDNLRHHVDQHMDHQDAAVEDGAGLMSMLRPKVELNDVPDLDTSMVPSGLSITAVNLAGGSGPNKRRFLDRQAEHLPARNNHQTNHTWDSPAPPMQQQQLQQHRGDHHGLSAHGSAGGARSAATPMARAARSGTPQQQANNHTASALEGRRLESRRRLEMLEEEHAAKMALLRVEKETAEVRRRIALRDERVGAGELTCRTCERAGGAGSRERDVGGETDATTKQSRGSPLPHHGHLLTTAKSDAGEDPDPDPDNVADASVPSSVASVGDEASTDNSSGGGDPADPSHPRGVNGSAGHDLE
ncbi:hypothetical protein FOCC_FOCC014064 [Frankliniella occidentalis]|nr:hypothetical protein FOCC_FOCC014064 [Frankliniella occidentalis]